jgi:hypothetical protein
METVQGYNAAPSTMGDNFQSLNGGARLYPEKGCHFEAFQAQGRLYRDQVERLRRENLGHALTLLDFGSGPYGCGRGLLEASGFLVHEDRLALFDPGTAIRPSCSPHVHIINEDDVFGPQAPSYDLINISYVLCLLEPDEARKILEHLRARHPQATITIIDYVLQGRTQADVLGLLTADEERNWIKKQGAEEFYRTHTRFTIESLAALVRDALHLIQSGMQRYLDRARLRAAVIVEGEPYTTKLTSFLCT